MRGIPLGLWRGPALAIHSSRLVSSVFRHAPDGQEFGRSRACQHPLEGFHPPPVAVLASLRNPNLHRPHRPLHMTPVDPVPVLRSVGKRRHRLFPMLYHAAFLSEDQGLSQPSCDERPGGSGLAFAPGDVPTRIPAITAGPSLFPPSHTRTAKAPLAVCLPRRQRYGLTTFLDHHTTGLGPVYSPVTFATTCPHYKQGHPATYRLVNAYQQLWHLKINDVYQQFTCVAHASQPSASPRCCFEDRHPCLTTGRTPCGGLHSGRASDKSVTRNACLPGLLLVVQQVNLHPGKTAFGCLTMRVKASSLSSRKISHLVDI
ncbi:hypothetical protein SAMN04244547_04574 [Azotobacter vinelandii]|nr:hypothetical protein SAMN04244547_04574 [Azotobacter vinelandii]